MLLSPAQPYLCHVATVFVDTSSEPWSSCSKSWLMSTRQSISTCLLGASSAGHAQSWGRGSPEHEHVHRLLFQRGPSKHLFQGLLVTSFKSCSFQVAEQPNH